MHPKLQDDDSHRWHSETMANLESAARELIDRSDAGLRGTPVFRGTRVPVRTLLDYLESGQK